MNMLTSALIPVTLITGTQIVLHGIGDYCLQSNWMADNKAKNSWVTIAHALTYSLPFLLLTPSLNAWLVIVISHFFIDRFRLIRYIIYIKHFLGPRSTWPKWEDCEKTGYLDGMEPYLKVWLMIISDNLLHIICNGLALYYL